MDDLQNLVEGLKSSDQQHAYRCLKQLETESERSAAVYPYFENFVEMLKDPNSYTRARAIILIAVNARWDVDHKIDEIIDQYLKHIIDEKPITARQCIRVLPLVIKYKPELGENVLNALHRANPRRYKESMQPLIARDIQKALETINKLQLGYIQR